MKYRGEMSGIVIKDGRKYLLLDSKDKIGESKKYNNGYLCKIGLSDEQFKKLKKNYIKRAIDLKREATSSQKAVVKNEKILEKEFEIMAEKNLFKFFDDFLNKFSNFYSGRDGAECLNWVYEKDVRKIEGLVSKNPKEVEKTIEMLGEIRNQLSKTGKWKKVLGGKKAKIAVVFPYYNEPTIVSNIRDIWELLEEQIIDEVIIADGWSTDPSAEVVKKRLNAPLTFIKNPGTGKGEALESAVKYAAAEGFDFVICLDSDIIPPLHIIKGLPPLPIDITCDFFARTFINKIVKLIKEHGKEKAKETFYKSSYMRIPKSGIDLMPLRFGGTTKFIKLLYKKLNLKVMKDCVYPLSGEYAFNPKFFLENLTIDKKMFKFYRKNYPGATLPSGFTIENFWNILIETRGLKVAFCNTFIHHHTTRGEKGKDKFAYAKQRATVFRGGFGAMLQSMPEEISKKYFKYFDFDLFRIPRPEIEAKIERGKVSAIKIK